MNTAFLSHPLFLQHQTGANHPEKAARMVAIERILHETGLWGQLQYLSFNPATEADLATCHTREHIQRVQSISRQGGGALDGDTIISLLSYDAACMASGAALRAVDAVMRGEVDNAFVAARPPGHHAESGRSADSPWGFCLFNHVAVAARYAQRHHGVERVAILDFDVHHGNGTQEIFYEDGSVFFASIHESPLFPYLGESSDRGAGEGLGTTLNIPLPAGSGSPEYRSAWEQVGQAVADFRPGLILLSAGYDAHRGDPLAHMELEASDYAALVTSAKEWAKSLCDGKIVAVLEGGYNLENLAAAVVATLQVLKAD
jgi:acetoin utilization deacetylase AcuC-like enzyme